MGEVVMVMQTRKQTDFKSWLTRRLTRNTDVGHMARDVQKEPAWKAVNVNYDEVEKFMIDRGHTSDCVRAAWDEWGGKPA